jgi:hypothetical protein
MVDPARREGTSEQGAAIEVPDESGPRRRPNRAEAYPPVEVDALEEVTELDLVELASPPSLARPRVPAPPPPSRRPPPPARDERVDLDALVARVASPRLTSPSIPPLAPLQPPPARPSWGLAIGLAGLALGVGVGGAALWLAKGEAVPSAAAPLPEAPEPVVEPEALAPAQEERPPMRQMVAHEVAAPEPSPAETTPPEPRRSTPAAQRTARRARRAAARENPAAVAPAPEPAPPAPEAAPEPASPTAASELPERPRRADVEQAVSGILPAVRACAPGTGQAELQLHFAPSGRVTTAQVNARLATPEQRSCMARAVRGAQVPPFSGQRLSVRYPVQL